MLYELRLYTVQPGRSADIEQRMLLDVPALFEEHGLHSIGHWRVVAGPDLPAFVYVMAWRDAAEREAGWARFYADERWWAVRARTNAGSELVEHYGLWLMKPLAMCDVPARLTGTRDEVHELVLHHVPIGRREAIDAHLRSTVLGAISAAGGRIWGGFEIVSGPRVPALVFIVAWPDYPSLRSGADALYASANAELLGRSDVRMLQPLPDMP